MNQKRALESFLGVRDRSWLGYRSQGYIHLSLIKLET